MTKVMAIILNYNTIEDSKKCALLLKKQKGIDLYITIVDNYSNDGKIEELRAFCSENDVRLIESKENRGFSFGNNLGLRLAAESHCKYGMIINPDVEIRKEDYIYESIKEMEKDSSIAVLGTDVINMEKQHQNPMRELKFSEEILWPLVLMRNKIMKTLPFVCNYKQSGYCKKISGCCFFIEIAFVAKIGYLDEQIFMYCEEPILAATVKKEGRKIFYKHDATAYHMHRSSEKGEPLKRLEMFFESRKYYLENYSEYGRIRKKMVLFSLKCHKKALLNKNGKKQKR